MKTIITIFGFLALGSTSFAGVQSLCTVTEKATSKTQTLRSETDLAQGTVDGVEFTILFNDPIGQSAQVGIEDTSGKASVIFYTPASRDGTFRDVVFFTTSAGRVYQLICKAAQ